MTTASEIVGFFGSGLVLLTFAMHDMRWLRTLAIFSNVAFIIYGALNWLLPVLALHLLLLPLNVLRLSQVSTTRPDK
jgi:CRP/FNR family transcriptional regulator, cyclic AMP receptor protein